jgi:hypothetical protein
MQTFMLSYQPHITAFYLDNKRLGKQRVEAMQIYKALTIPTYGWRNHPAVKMWKGYEQYLIHYGIEMCSEWKRRGFKDSMWEQFHALWDGHYHWYPVWLNDAFIHAHMSNLKRKDSAYYTPRFEFWGTIPDNLPYIWPVQTKLGDYVYVNPRTAEDSTV